MFKYQIKTFSNGLRLLMVPSKESLSFRILVLVNTGSDFETKRTNGISHFLEHLCFKGTKKRPSNLLIAQELDRVGGAYNAFTSREITGYYAAVYKDFKELAVDIVSDIYLNSLFPEKEIEKEKGVIIEEINMYNDLPPDYIWDLWFKLIYGNNPFGFSVLGPVENIKRFKRKDFLRYYKKQYKSKSSLVVVSGNFKESEIEKLVKKYFALIPKGKGEEKKSKVKINKERVLIKYQKTDQTHFILGVDAFKMDDKKIYPLIVLDTILDAGMSGYLWQLIREKLGAAYYIHSNISSFTDRGFWVIKAGVNNDKIYLVIKEILNELKKLKKEYLTLDNLKKAKDNIKGHVALKTENVHNVASYYGEQLLLLNKIETYEKYLQIIDKVSLSDIKKVADKLLQSSKLKLALIGPVKKKDELLKILKF